MRRAAVLFLLFLVVGQAGCVISTQVGERTHVNTSYPDEMTFHFNTTYNKAILFGRSAALVLISLWAFSQGKKWGGSKGYKIIALAALVGSGWLLVTGWVTVFHYRIEVRNELLHLSIPLEHQEDISWRQIESIEFTGKAHDVSLGAGEAQAMKYASEWEDLTLMLADGQKREIDLRPLSVEQRGTLWRAIARKAELQVKTWVEPAKR